MKTLRTALVVPALLLSTCALAQSAGSGGSREENRQVQDFTGVQVGQGLKAQISVGPKSVRVTGDEKLVGLVRTEVENGQLVVRMEKDSWFRRSSGVRIFISSPQVTSVVASGGAEVDVEAKATENFTAEASGGADLSVNGVDAKRLKVEASGGAEVTLKGRADTLSVEASGGAEVDGEELSLRELDVEASSGASVEANPSDRIKADISSGSSVEVDSSPTQREISSSSGAGVSFSKR